MNGGSKIVDLRISDVDFSAADAPPVVDEVVDEPAEAHEELLDDTTDETPSRGIGWTIIGILAVLVSLAWIGFFGWYASPLIPLPAPFALAQLATGMAALPVLIAVLWLVLRRSSRIEARGFAKTARSMRAEATHLQDTIDVMAQVIDSNREKLADQVTVMMATAAMAADRLQEASHLLDREFTKAEADVARIDGAASNLEANLQIMLATLPKAHAETVSLTENVERVGLTASERAAALDAQVVALGERARDVDTHTGGAAERLSAHIARMEATSETAGARLESVTATMAETVDGLLDRTASAVDEARKGITTQGDAMLAMLAANQATLDRTANDSAAALAERIAAIESVVNHVAEVLATGQAQVEAIARSIDDSSGAAQRFAGESAPQLLEGLMRIRDTANAAADHAREAIERIVPDASSAIEAAGREALQKSLAAIAEAQQTAAASATEASDKLNQQMIAIAEASGVIDERLADAEDSDGFARRVSLLIESLNSAAIDLAGIYATDVPDSSWLAYLKGNHGVFTRRAVKLLDAGDKRAIVAAYEDDDVTRERINRYIHDFEAMLRAVLAQRDSAAIGVTLLSSDMGKLYVALAQAIKRLRT